MLAVQLAQPIGCLVTEIGFESDECFKCNNACLQLPSLDRESDSRRSRDGQIHFRLAPLKICRQLTFDVVAYVLASVKRFVFRIMESSSM